ncbi:uncharacterized protein N7496_009664 [Penicillium cataractarum]|uniref:VIT domain-containing protein n=1 Tax=Penicillium cataractarum TaxID=2100454 RepID=A0A9W9RPX2_9EURO|nr:uncharacterized protein N7496_009664 [Penicillium cataractarum]KAJ5363951.1 hypothetical protein N7496_009664 [Penicillium cataractarum]
MLGYSGCCYYSTTWCYLPQVSVTAHATILSSASRTTLTQTFVNPSEVLIKEVSYTFPLYDGVSVVGFECRVGSRLLHSKVKTKEQAESEYQDAVTNQETAAIMDHTVENDIFVIRLGNVPAKETITVDITFVGELKQDPQSDGVRYTLPNSIAPRYPGNLWSSNPAGFLTSHGLPADLKGITITVDVLMEKDSIIRELHSPSHAVKASLGRMSSTPADAQSFDPSNASATLRLTKGEYALLERDFVLVVKADGLDNPRALLETHPTLPKQRALMATLVPKFSLPPAQPEVVFVIDRSGSMHDKIQTLTSALQIFLKSLPVGICFNICSFGSSFSFLWPTSRVYDASSLEDALCFVSTISANMGGTEMQHAVEATVANRLKGKDLELLLLTDGEIWRQDMLFDFVRKSAADNTARFFSLAIGDAASHALVEGVARAVNGFSQSVINYEELDRKVVRMLKGALTPHIFDYKLEVQYDGGKADDDFEIVDSDIPMSDSETEIATPTSETSQQTPTQQPISLFDANFKESDAELGSRQQADDKSLLPIIPPPRALQAPYKIPSLYPFIRTTVYLLLDPRSSHRIPKSLTFRATSKLGPLELQIPIGDSGKGETIHQLGSRKAVIELEENHGWLQDSRDESGNPFRQLHSNTQQRIVARECQTLGIKYQVTGKYCSFVALESDDSSNSEERGTTKEIETQTVPVVKTTRTSHRSSRLLAKPTTAHSGGGGIFATYSAGPPPQSASTYAARSRQVVMAPKPLIVAQAFGSSKSSLGSPAPAPPPPPPPASGRALPRMNAMMMPSRPAFGAFSRSPPARISSSEGDGQAQSPAQPSAFGAPSGGLFGSSTQQSTGGSLFGRPSQAQAQAQSSPSAAPSGSLFGSSTQPTAGGYLCGGQSSGSTPFGSAAPPPPTSMPEKKALFVARQERDNAEPLPLTNQPTVHALVRLQSFEGSWEWKQTLFDVIGCQMTDVQAQILRLLQVEDFDSEAGKVVATILALGFLVNKHADSKGLWELVSDKAEAWISQRLPAMPLGQVIESHKSDIMALA